MEGKTAQRIGRPLIWFTVVAFLFVIAVVFAGPSAAHHVLRFVLHELPFMGQTFTPSAWARGRDWQRCERGSVCGR